MWPPTRCSARRSCGWAKMRRRRTRFAAASQPQSGLGTSTLKERCRRCSTAWISKLLEDQMTARRVLATVFTACCLLPAACQAADERFARIEPVVNEAIQRRDIPGAVVAVLHRGEVVYRKAFGNRAVQPAAEPMTVDTVFDLA